MTQSDPIILSAETRLEPGSSSGVNTAALKNPHGLPMELLWVRFSLYPLVPPATTNQEVVTSMTGMVIGVKMDLGKIPIVDAGVPISCFGAAHDDWNITNEFFVTPLMRAVHNTYTWRLKHPLLIPAGATVVPLFQHYGQIPFPANVRVTYMCRSLSGKLKTKKQVWVPWVTSWRSRAFEFQALPTDLKTQYDDSSELDIVNPFDVPVSVVRFGGRQSLTSPESNLQNSETALNYPIFSYITGAGDSHIRVTMKSSSGDELVRTNTQFGALFPLNLKVWDIAGGWLMAPGEYVKVRAEFKPTAIMNFSGRVQVGISSVGYRKIDLGSFA